jgi:O-antigen/teichoic acid export membrane protein
MGSVRSGVIKGVFWTVGARWALRALGLISTILLARLLMPRDFGVMAMATVVIGFLDVLFAQGVDIALIQNASSTRAHWDAAWTVRVLQGTIMASLLVALAPLASRYYGEPRINFIMPILAVGTLATAAENIGPVAFRKDLQFHRDFQFTVAKKLVQFVIVVSLAFVWRDYRALMFGVVISSVASSCLSYGLHPFRPKWSLAKAAEIWGFSFRLAAINFANYVNFNAEKVVLGGIVGAEKTGIYFVGDEIAELPYSELVAPTSRVTVPGFAKIKHDPERLTSGLLKVLGLVALLSIPAAAGLVLVSYNLVTVLLGPRWTDATDVIRLCAVSAGFVAIYSVFGNLLTILGRLNVIICIASINAVLFVALLFPMVRHHGILGAAGLKAMLSIVVCILYGYLISRTVQVTIAEMVAVLWRPLVSTAVMIFPCIAVAGVLTLPAAALICQIAVGVTCYTIAAYGVWVVSGCPDGAERDLLKMVGDRIRDLHGGLSIFAKYRG